MSKVSQPGASTLPVVSCDSPQTMARAGVAGIEDEADGAVARQIVLGDDVGAEAARALAEVAPLERDLVRRCCDRSAATAPGRSARCVPLLAGAVAGGAGAAGERERRPRRRARASVAPSCRRCRRCPATASPAPSAALPLAGAEPDAEPDAERHRGDTDGDAGPHLPAAMRLRRRRRVGGRHQRHGRDRAR